MGHGVVTLFLCGDVMLGRGVDQILPNPGDPELREAYVVDARSYVRMAEEVSGAIPAPVDPPWPWGEALPLLDEAAPDARIVNLETSVTRAGDFAPGKAVHYRMHPGNLPALAAARPDVCVLANNHVLDFGRAGLAETLGSLAGAGLRTAGAGRDAGEAYAPAVVPLPSGGRVLVFALGAGSSGVPSGWAAAEGRSGVAYVPALSAAAAAAVVRRVGEVKRVGDVVVVSVHWGSNWGYLLPGEQTRFAHALVDGGVDVVHGHSSHHPRSVEVYRGRLVLHGCGDFVDDYEGITGYEEYRADLRLAFLVTLASDSGLLTGLRMVPLRSRRMRLEAATPTDREWLLGTLDRVSRGVRITQEPDGSFAAQP
ncbi:CapA family protein [Streptomyces cocklensis]|jgi:poly-gamma-glutamate synthesis protein (capsule biosynthesis protein)|uniref:PGA_cap domain-containing protein n=1 Tax=Actinacidiphila cocklensis TaxID=887465 RepID=A0A9W4DYV8_9ACTN|nr:CapA family protein [Actinacidiphila cocklensis]MDD1063341.1 CapA family protein [Actinacidiphila cocklensis]WSX74898.1 CapA family protein [Streptomyces sp. NBC_00899]CAG6399053.1 PGA_cap domain-containing protein [Actinacidiphila cocklensis]